MNRENDRRRIQGIKGFSLIELLVVVAVASIMTAVAVPQMISQRRLTRSTAVTQEIMTQMRYARQLAMSRRRAFTFQYDDANKRVRVIGPIPAGIAALTAAGYPSNAGSAVMLSVPLTQGGGLTASDLSTGIPTGLPGSPTSVDGIAGTTLAGGTLNITFQPDGSVIDTTGNPIDRGLFIYNNKASKATASAITVRGASGRVKVWRYTPNVNANASNYAD